MAIHINEIVFKATIQEDNDKKGGGGGGKMDEKEREKIVATCIEQVLEIMKRKHER